MLCQAGLSRASPPGPLSITDGEGEEVLAHGSWGGLGPDRVQMWCMCAVFFGGFPLALPVDAIKGVQMLPITLGFACLSHCLSVYHAHWSGRYTPAA